MHIVSLCCIISQIKSSKEYSDKNSIVKLDLNFKLLMEYQFKDWHFTKCAVVYSGKHSQKFQ